MLLLSDGSVTRHLQSGESDAVQQARARRLMRDARAAAAAAQDAAALGALEREGTAGGVLGGMVDGMVGDAALRQLLERDEEEMKGEDDEDMYYAPSSAETAAALRVENASSRVGVAVDALLRYAGDDVVVRGPGRHAVRVEAGAGADGGGMVGGEGDGGGRSVYTGGQGTTTQDVCWVLVVVIYCAVVYASQCDHPHVHTHHPHFTHMKSPTCNHPHVITHTSPTHINPPPTQPPPRMWVPRDPQELLALAASKLNEEDLLEAASAAAAREAALVDAYDPANDAALLDAAGELLAALAQQVL